MRHAILHLLLLVAIAGSASPAASQATTRVCSATEDAGPACLLVHQPLRSLPAGPIFWIIDRFASRKAAEAAGIATSSIVEAFGSTWLFTLQQKGWRPAGGAHVAEIGPIAVTPASTYAVEYLRSIFAPGTSAPLHVHSGPEAFYAVSGDTCLETPDGVQIGRGSGNSLTIRAGPPMLLMAIGTVPRRGFALILHDAGQPPTTLTQSWQPQGLCARQLAADQGR